MPAKNSFLILLLLLTMPFVSIANERQSAIDAVESVMFDLDELGIEYVNYRVDASGNVSMTVDDTVPEELYVKLLTLIKSNRAVNSTLASQGPVCPIPYISNKDR